MTRFARAKGSKSSNLKAPDDSTPWEVMKEQMLQAKKETEDNKNRQLAENQRIENYSNFLKEQKVQKRKSTWCDFPETENIKKAKLQQQLHENKSSKNKNKANKVIDNQTELSQEGIIKEPLANVNVTDVNNEKKKKKNKSKTNKISHESNHNNEDTKDRINDRNIDVQIKKKKNKLKSKQVTPESHESGEGNNRNKEEIELEEGKVKNKKKNKQPSSDMANNGGGLNDQPSKQIDGNQKKKNKKNRGEKPTRRKEINDRSFQLIINGKEVELIRFDGFPIMKKDAERLNELKTSMMKKGIPKTEVNRTIKLERRRAEKALARLKRDVCYNCRKGGHNLSDCPDLKSNIPGVGAAEGICFKCGSTEHRQFECKVQRDKEFRFANCFICKEQGHIARQCPDNPKGLYPNGGCCKLCGDVTHLRKDCPTVQNQKEGTSIKLQTLDTENNLEDIDVHSKPVAQEAPRKPKKIKF